MIQAASDAGNAAGLVYFIFDLLHLDGEDLSALPLIERKARLAALLSNVALSDVRQAATAEVRLDAGKSARSSVSAQSIGWFGRLPRTPCAFAVVEDAQTGDPCPQAPESGGCRPKQTCNAEIGG
jgi:hypothetical protein